MCGGGEGREVLAGLGGELDDPVVHVGDVHDLAAPASPCTCRVRRSRSVATKRAEVADVAAAVDGEAADVHAHLGRLLGRERLHPAGQGVVEAQGHASVGLQDRAAVRSSEQPAGPVQALDGVQQGVERRLGAAARRPRARARHTPLVAELLVVRGQRLGGAVGHHGQQRRRARARPRPTRTSASSSRPSTGPARAQALDVAALARSQERRHVAGVDVARAGARAGSSSRVEQRDVAVGLRALVEEAVEPRPSARAGGDAAGQRAQRGVHGGHQDAGRRALAGDVGDGQGQPAARRAG